MFYASMMPAEVYSLINGHYKFNSISFGKFNHSLSKISTAQTDLHVISSRGVHQRALPLDETDTTETIF